MDKQVCCRALTFEEAGDQFVHDVLQSLVRPGWRLTNVTGAVNIYVGEQGKGGGTDNSTQHGTKTLVRCITRASLLCKSVSNGIIYIKHVSIELYHTEKSSCSVEDLNIKR